MDKAFTCLKSRSHIPSICLTARNAILLLFIGMLIFSIICGDVVQMVTEVSD